MSRHFIDCLCLLALNVLFLDDVRSDLEQAKDKDTNIYAIPITERKPYEFFRLKLSFLITCNFLKRLLSYFQCT